MFIFIYFFYIKAGILRSRQRRLTASSVVGRKVGRVGHSHSYQNHNMINMVRGGKERGREGGRERQEEDKKEQFTCTVIL